MTVCRLAAARSVLAGRRLALRPRVGLRSEASASLFGPVGTQGQAVYVLLERGGPDPCRRAPARRRRRGAAYARRARRACFFWSPGTSTRSTPIILRKPTLSPPAFSRTTSP